MKFIGTLLLVWSCFQLGTTQETPSDEQIREFIEVSGYSNTLKAQIPMMNKFLRENQEVFGIEENYLNELLQIVEERGYDMLLPRAVEVYRNRLTRAEVEAAIRFYRSPEGRSFAEKQPLVAQDLSEVGRQWGEELIPMVIAELEDKEQEKLRADFERIPEEDLSRFRTGTFTSPINETKEVTILREEKHQIEIIDGIRYKYAIEWISNHRYLILDLDEAGDPVEDSELIINIYRADGSTFYYVLHHPASGAYHAGEMTKVVSRS